MGTAVGLPPLAGLADVALQQPLVAVRQPGEAQLVLLDVQRQVSLRGRHVIAPHPRLLEDVGVGVDDLRHGSASCAEWLRSESFAMSASSRADNVVRRIGRTQLRQRLA